MFEVLVENLLDYISINYPPLLYNLLNRFLKQSKIAQLLLFLNFVIISNILLSLYFDFVVLEGFFYIKV